MKSDNILDLMPKINMKQYGNYIRFHVNTPYRKPLIAVGPIGCGKTSIAEQIAIEKGWSYRTMRLGEMEITDLAGFPIVSKDGTMHYAKPPMLPDWDEYCLIILDEINRAAPEVISAVFRMLEGRGTMGWKHNHERHWIVGGINPSGQASFVGILDDASIGRCCLFYVEPTVKEWLEYAHEKELDQDIIGYVSANNDKLYVPTPQDRQGKEINSANPRNYDDLSYYIKPMTPQERKTFLSGYAYSLLGLDVAPEFIHWVADPERPINAADVMKGKWDEALFAKHQKENLDKAFSTILDLTTLINVMQPAKAKAKMKNIQKFYEALSNDDVKGAFFKYLNQGAHFDNIIKLIPNAQKEANKAYDDVDKLLEEKGLKADQSK